MYIYIYFFFPVIGERTQETIEEEFCEDETNESQNGMRITSYNSRVITLYIN